MERREFLSLLGMCAGTALMGLEEGIGHKALLRGSVANPLIPSLLTKLETVQKWVGYVRFNTISFDEALKIASQQGVPFSTEEIGYIESIFYGDPRRYGFYGERTVPRLTSAISEKDLVYVKKTGHFLLKGAATEKYATIKKLLGDEVVLTSGVRAPVKQLYLFVRKTVSANGDLRLASTSIAPPGFTFHSVGDFDIGKSGYGAANFSEKFEQTDVFKKLYDGGYITIRYTTNNPFGVRYEPWHIKVTGGNETA